MFIGRRPDGTIYGSWTSRQPDDADHTGMEEVSDDHPDLVAFVAPKQPQDKRQAAITVVEQILASPTELAALKQALGI